MGLFSKKKKYYLYTILKDGRKGYFAKLKTGNYAVVKKLRYATTFYRENIVEMAIFVKRLKEIFVNIDIKIALK